MAFLEGIHDNKVYNPWTSEGKIEKELPTELREFFASMDVGYEFKITVQCFANALRHGRPQIVAEYTNEVPNYHELVKMNGVGYYRYKIVYTNERDKEDTKNVDVDLVSKNWKEVEDEGNRERKARRRERLQEEADENRFLNGMASGNQGESKSTGESLKEGIEAVRPLLELAGIGSKGAESKNVDPMILMMIQQQNQSRQLFEKVLITIAPILIEKMFNRPNQDPTDKLLTMAEKMLNFKEMITPKEETLIEKIGNFIGSNADTIMALLSRPVENKSIIEKQQNDWRVKKTKEKMMANPEFAKAIIKHVEGKVGPETTDKLLKDFLKYERPEQKVKDVEEAEEAEEVPSEEISPDDFED
jgi:hypothetical protein